MCGHLYESLLETKLKFTALAAGRGKPFPSLSGTVVLLSWRSFLSGTGAPCELSGQTGAEKQPLHLWVVLGVAVGGEAALLHQERWDGLQEDTGKRLKMYHERLLFC